MYWPGASYGVAWLTAPMGQPSWEPQAGGIARIQRMVSTVVDDASLGGRGAAAWAGAVADGAAVGLDEEVERAVAVAAVAHDVNVAGGKSLSRRGRGRSWA